MNAPLPSGLHPWLAPAWEALTAHIRINRIPQALLIHGESGLGKLQLAEHFARALMCAGPGETACGVCPSCRLFEAGTHPDFRKLEPEEPGKPIKVESVRRLITDLALKSQYDAYRVVVFNPAHKMNASSANALLKTLEEPAERTVMLLLTDAPAELPATIRSRCQKIAIQVPGRAAAEAWLEREHPGCPAAILLAASNGSPLKALALAGTDVVSRREAVFGLCRDMLAGRQDPVLAAEQWHSQSHEEYIDWMLSWVADLMRLACAGGHDRLRNPDLSEGLRSMAKQTTPERLANYWERLLQARRGLAGQANRQLLLEDTLIHWSRLAGGKQRVSS